MRIIAPVVGGSSLDLERAPQTLSQGASCWETGKWTGCQLLESGWGYNAVVLAGGVSGFLASTAGMSRGLLLPVMAKEWCA